MWITFVDHLHGSPVELIVGFEPIFANLMAQGGQRLLGARSGRPPYRSLMSGHKSKLPHF